MSNYKIKTDTKRIIREHQKKILYVQWLGSSFWLSKSINMHLYLPSWLSVPIVYVINILNIIIIKKHVRLKNRHLLCRYFNVNNKFANCIHYTRLVKKVKKMFATNTCDIAAFYLSIYYSIQLAGIKKLELPWER